MVAEPQVVRWWNHDTTDDAVERDFGPSVRGEEPGEDLIVSLDGCPIGLLQRALIRDYPKDLDAFAAILDVPDGAVELDYLIGDADVRGRGVGARMITAAVEHLEHLRRRARSARGSGGRQHGIVAGAREGGSAAGRRRCYVPG